MRYVDTVSKKPFGNMEDSWPPDTVVVDALTGRGSLYHHGEIYPCTYEECKEFEVCAAWHINQVIDMLMGDDNKKTQKRVKVYLLVVHTNRGIGRRILLWSC